MTRSNVTGNPARVVPTGKNYDQLYRDTADAYTEVFSALSGDVAAVGVEAAPATVLLEQTPATSEFVSAAEVTILIGRGAGRHRRSDSQPAKTPRVDGYAGRHRPEKNRPVRRLALGIGAAAATLAAVLPAIPAIHDAVPFIPRYGKAPAAAPAVSLNPNVPLSNGSPEPTVTETVYVPVEVVRTVTSSPSASITAEHATVSASPTSVPSEMVSQSADPSASASSSPKPTPSLTPSPANSAPETIVPPLAGSSPN